MSRQPFNPDLALGGAGPKRSDGASADAPLTVSQLTNLVKDAIERALPATVHVVGQISNFKRHSSGHLYFTLKDESCELACVMWRSSAANIKFDIADGLDVVATGQVSVFERTGRYQLYARKLEPRGMGALELAFRQLCEKLSVEGLFEPAHKKSLPRYPQRIAVVTSPTGAAVRDVLTTLARRFPAAEVLLLPVRVQGPGAGQEIAAAIRAINQKSAALGGIDVMIVGRGGGSIEDLWAFNEEVVARAIYASAIPVISAVGHESDVTIADLVADVRAATPTAAAELAVPTATEVLEELSYRQSLLHRTIRHQMELAWSRIEANGRRSAFADPAVLVRERHRRLDELCAGMYHALAHRIHGSVRRVAAIELILRDLRPDRYYQARRLLLVDLGHRLRFALTQSVARAEQIVTESRHRLVEIGPHRRVEAHRLALKTLERRLDSAAQHCLEHRAQQVNAQQARLSALNHKQVLARGFSITRLAKNKAILRSKEKVKEGDHIVTELQDGQFESRVVDSNQPELFE